jgi:hypothetical protein
MFMLMNISLSLFVLLFLSTKSLATTATTTAATTTALDDYVWKHDDNYNWVEMPQYGMKNKKYIDVVQRRFDSIY